MKGAPADLALLILRVAFGVGIASHGYGKVFTEGRIASLAVSTTEMGFPVPTLFAWAAALSEFLGGILVALGLATRPAAFFAFCTMSVAAFIRHRAGPSSERELALAYWTVFLVLMLTGPGRISMDRALGREKG